MRTKIARVTISLPPSLLYQARQDAETQQLGFSTYVRLLLERRLGLGLERVPARVQDPFRVIDVPGRQDDP
jgi:hypothetical protein